MRKTSTESLLAGSTNEALGGKPSAPSMKHGEESHAMLLALLNSPLESLIDCQQARIMGTVRLKDGHNATVIFFYDAKPTANRTLEVI